MDYASLKTFKILTLNKSYVFHSFLQSCYIKKIVERAVLRDSFRFPEINLAAFCHFNSGTGHLTPKKYLGRKGPHGGEFDQKKIKNVKCLGVSPGGGGGGGGGWGWALLDLTHT